MSFISVFLMSFALAMDAFAVSMTKGMTLRKINFSIASKIKTVDHWIALFLLGFIGLKMILEAKNDNSLDDISYDKLGIKELIVLSIATSIDALAVGVSFAFLNEPIFSISSTIAIVTFILCFLGVLLGKSIGSLFKNYAQIVGGIILILIGFNILNGHTGIITSFF